MMGIELPLKLLIAQTGADTVEISYPDMAHTFHEYSLTDHSEVLGKIGGALSAIAAEAAGG